MPIAPEQPDAASRPRPRPVTRPGPRSPLWVIVVLGCVLAAAFAVAAPQKFSTDDGLFYVQIARNVVEHGRVSFHRITDTNGFHPLWEAICSLLGLAFTTHGQSFLRVVVAFQQLLFLVACLFLVKLCRYVGVRRVHLSVALLGLFFLGKGNSYLLETFLAIALVAAAAYAYVTRFAPDVPIARLPAIALVGYGALLGLVVLARLDLVFLVGVLVSAGFLRRARATGVAQAFQETALVGAPIVVLVGGYALANHHYFGSYVPISGAIKNTFPRPDFSLAHLGVNGMFFALVPVTALVTVALRRRHMRERAGPSASLLEHLIVVLAVADVLYFLYLASFSGAAEWYFVTSLYLVGLGVAYISAVLSDAIPGVWARFYTGAVVLVSLGVAVMGFLRAFTDFQIKRMNFGDLHWAASSPVERASRQLQRAIPSESRVLVFDSPGGLAFFSDLAILPVDGLVNAVSYEHELMALGVRGFLCGNRIDYVLAPIPRPGVEYNRLCMSMRVQNAGYLMTVWGPRSRRRAGDLFMDPASLVTTMNCPVDEVVAAGLPTIGLFRVDCGKGRGR